MSDSNNEGNAAGQLLEILATLHPESMDFSNALGKDEVAEDVKSGTTFYLLKGGLIERHGKEKYRYRITEKGKQMVESADTPKLDAAIEKLMMPSLQPFNWEHKDVLFCEPLLKHGENIPLITIGADRPEMFEPLQRTPNNEKHYDLFRAAAFRNITKIDLKTQDVKMGDFVMTVVVGSYYAAEKILDKNFMFDIQKKHDYHMLAVALPRKGTMYVTNGILQPQVMGKFMQVAAMKFGENEQTKPLSTTIFIVQDGEISGVIQPQTSENASGKKTVESEKKSFWKKLFG
jgi:hypothetical protein